VIYTVSAASATPVNSNWLAASITSGAGTTPGTVTVTVTPGNLPASTTPYQGTITITSSGATGSPITIPVTLTVEQATLIAPTTALTFNQLAGGAAPAAQSVAVTSTPGPIPITVSATTTNGVAWLSATAGSNGATGTTPATVQISVNSGSLPAGPYSGLVIITSAGATGSPIGIPVLLNVGTASVFTISQTSLTFSASLGQATTPQTVQLTATSSAPFAVATTTKDGASWLTASPSSGTAGSTATTLTISANTQSLAVGNYSGAITISSANILTPVTINVSLTVSAIPTPVLVAVKNAASYVAGAVSPGEDVYKRQLPHRLSGKARPLRAAFHRTKGHGCDVRIAGATPRAATIAEMANQIFAVFDTTAGTFKVKLFAEQAPKTVENFVSLADGAKTGKPFYDGTVFHRVIPGFMVQGGDPEGTGRGGPGYKFADEFHPDLKHTKPGILSMANSGPNTNGSQFFITVAATSWLDKKHSVFGEVVEGYDIVKQISEAPRGPQDRPSKEVLINSVKIEKL